MNETEEKKVEGGEEAVAETTPETPAENVEATPTEETPANEASPVEDAPAAEATPEDAPATE